MHIQFDLQVVVERVAARDGNSQGFGIDVATDGGNLVRLDRVMLITSGCPSENGAGTV